MKLKIILLFIFILVKSSFSYSQTIVTIEPKVSIELRDAEITTVLRAIAEKTGVNMVAHESVKGKITVSLREVALSEALRVILIANNFSYQKIDNTIFVATPDKIKAGEDYVIDVIKLEYADPVEVKRLLIDLGLGTANSIQIYQGGTSGLYGVSGGAGVTGTTGVSGVGVSGIGGAGLGGIGGLTVSENTASSIRNILIVQDRKEIVSKIKDFIRKIDTPPTQILIEARIEQIAKEGTKELGPFWQTSDVGLKFTEQDPGLVTGRLHTFTRNAIQINSTLDLLETKNKAKSLARPKILTVDGKMAQIFIGTKIPLPITERDQWGNIIVTEAYTADSNVGIRLQIIPRAAENGEISIDIITEVSSVLPTTPGKLPDINTRSTKNFLRVKDGETIVLGGLLSHEETKSISQVPLLGDIPIIGSLFKSVTKEKTENEVMVFITPQIIKNMPNIQGSELIK